MKLRKQERVLIEYLLRRKTWVTSDELSSFLNVSIRTLRSSIKDLNSIVKVIDSSNYGYRVHDIEVARKLVGDKNNSIEYSVRSRQNSIIKRLILSESNLNIYKLSEELCISDSTMQADLISIKKRLEQYQIGLEISENNILVISDETKYRKLMSSILYEEANDGFMSYDILSEMFPTYDILSIRKIIIEELANNELLANDYGLICIILHFCILFYCQHFNSISRHTCISTNDEKYKATQKILNRLETEEGIIVNKNKQDSFEAIIALYCRPMKKERLNLISQQNLDQNIYEFVVDLTSLLYKKYFVNIQDDTFINGLTLHLEQLLANEKRHLKNPLIETIRNGSPVIYELAVITAQAINAKWPQLDLDEHEISYLAIHIGLVFEKKEKEKLNIALINLDYNNSNEVIVNKIKNIFFLNINRIDVYSNEAEVQENRYDLILSTLKTKRQFSNVVQISLFINNNDEVMIQKAINEAILKKENTIGISMLSLFNKSHFKYFDKKDDDYTSVIRDLCTPIINDGIEKQDFIERVITREQVSPTSYLNIAIPHTFDFYSQKTSISVGLFKYPIIWGANKVNIVFLLSISKTDQKAFIKILEKLIRLFTSDIWIKEVKRIDTYQKFIDFIDKNKN